MNIGIYGGTFDPPHIGHVTAARAAMDALQLDRLILIPDAQPPHKALPAGSAAAGQRYDMAVLATAELGRAADVAVHQQHPLAPGRQRNGQVGRQRGLALVFAHAGDYQHLAAAAAQAVFHPGGQALVVLGKTLAGQGAVRQKGGLAAVQQLPRGFVFALVANGSQTAGVQLLFNVALPLQGAAPVGKRQHRRAAQARPGGKALLGGRAPV